MNANTSNAAALVGLEDQVGELLNIGQPAHRAHRVLKHLAAVHGRLAELPGRDLGVLLLDGHDHVGRRQAAHRHLGRVEPQPHAIVALAEVGDVADAGQARQLVADLDRRVVAQVEAGAVVVRREEVDDHQDVRRLLLDGDAAPLH